MRAERVLLSSVVCVALGIGCSSGSSSTGSGATGPSDQNQGGASSSGSTSSGASSSGSSSSSQGSSSGNGSSGTGDDGGGSGGGSSDGGSYDATSSGDGSSSSGSASSGSSGSGSSSGGSSGSASSSGSSSSGGGSSGASHDAGSSSGGSSGSSGSSSSGSASSSGSSSSGGGSSSGSHDAGSSGDASTSSDAAASSDATSSGDGGSWAAGNPSGSCTTLTLPTEAQAVDTSHPTTTVGTGTPSTCTYAALSQAVKNGGIIAFNCGPSPLTITVTATLKPPVSTGNTPVHIVIDGGNKVTLDGGGTTQIISWVHNTWRTSQDTLTLQHIQLNNGKATGTTQIPACTTTPNAQCSTGYTDGQGGAVYMADGSLRVIDSIFTGNQAAKLGPDTGGGALYLFGSGTLSYVAHSTFKNNTASNAGAIGMLWVGANIYDSLFDGNSAVGTGANGVDATQCSCNDGNGNQTGSGGNGGAIYKDGGDGVNLTLCGDLVQNNSANEFGSAAFLTADGSAAKLVIDDSVLKNNHSPIPYWNWCMGVSTDTTTTSPQPIASTLCDACGTCQTGCSSTSTCGK